MIRCREGGRAAASQIGTLVERTTRFTMLVPLPHSEAAAFADAVIPVIGALPDAVRRSLTWDQGKEMRQHARISVAADCEIYFCDPHSPWQRGSNENTNGLLRQYFPKGSDLSAHSPQRLAEVADELNGRPRKTLGWRTPAEALAELLCEIWCDLLILRLAEILQVGMQLGIADQLQKRRLFELDGERFFECGIENRIAGLIGEVGENELIFVGELHSSALAEIKSSGDDCEHEDDGKRNHPLEPGAIGWSFGCDLHLAG